MSELSVRVDAVVIGGGAMGSAAAWQLAARGADVVLLERFGPAHANGASHGASRIFRLSYADPVYVDLAREARSLWRELEELSGTALLTITGGLDHGPHPYLDELTDALTHHGITTGWLDPDEAADRWPGIRIDTRALWHPDSGRLHADAAVAALQQAAQKHGAVVLHDSPVESISVRDGGHAVEVHTATASWRAPRVVVAVGAWTTTLLDGLVPLPALVVTQEQPAHFADRTSDAAWPSFGHLFAPDSPNAAAYHGGIYGLATPGEGIKVGFHGVGPRVDPDGRDFEPEPQQLTALRDYARTWLPGVDADAFTPISCTYTTSPDSNFVIDRHGPLVVAGGFSGHGFKFTPAIGRLLADLAADDDAITPDLFSLRPRDPKGTP